MILFKIWSICKIFSVSFETVQASEGNIELSHCSFPLVSSESTPRLPDCTDKISVGKGGRKDCQSKTTDKLLSHVSAYFLHGLGLNCSRMFTQRNKEVRNSFTYAICTNSMSKALQLIPSCCSPIWREKDAHQRWSGLTVWVAQWPLSYCH